MPVSLLRTPNPRRFERAMQEAIREEMQAEGRKTRDDWRRGVRKDTKELERSIVFRTTVTAKGVELNVFSKKKVGRKGWFHADLDNKGWQHTGHDGRLTYVDNAKNSRRGAQNRREWGRAGNKYPKIAGTGARDKAEEGLRSRLRGRKRRIAGRVAQKVNRRG